MAKLKSIKWKSEGIKHLFEVTHIDKDGREHSSSKEYERKEFSDYKDQFQWFIAAAILLLWLDTLTLERKTRWLQILDIFHENEE